MEKKRTLITKELIEGMDKTYKQLLEAEKHYADGLITNSETTTKIQDLFMDFLLNFSHLVE